MPKLEFAEVTEGTFKFTGRKLPGGERLRAPQKVSKLKPKR